MSWNRVKEICILRQRSKKIEDHRTYCIVSYEEDTTPHQITSKVVINAAEPWVNEVLDTCIPKPNMLNIDLVLGSHILVDKKVDRIYYIEAKDKRSVFVRPYHNGTLIGTTEVRFTSSLKHIDVPPSDIPYLIDNFNHYFKTKITTDNIINSFAGLRALPCNDKKVFKKSREVTIWQDKINTPNVYSIYGGGKLTSYRATARKVLKKIKPSIT